MTPNDRVNIQKAGMILGSLFGAILAVITWEDWSYRNLLLTAPERVTLRQLIDQGYSGKRHIHLTDFRFASGYAIEEKSETWLRICVPLFAIDDPNPQEILAVVESRDVRHIKELPEIYSLAELDGVLDGKRGLGLMNKILSDGNKKIPIESPLVLRHFQEIPSTNRIRICLAGSILSLMVAAYSFGRFRSGRRQVETSDAINKGS